MVARRVTKEELKAKHPPYSPSADALLHFEQMGYNVGYIGSEILTIHINTKSKPNTKLNGLVGIRLDTKSLAFLEKEGYLLRHSGACIDLNDPGSSFLYLEFEKKKPAETPRLTPEVLERSTVKAPVLRTKPL